MTLIIGIDPGSRRTGYGIIQQHGNNRLTHITSGCLDVTRFTPMMRLRQIYLGLISLLDMHHPEEAAIEKVFMHENPNSAIKLGQARGACLVVFEVPIAEYSAREIKKSITAYGAADKLQVQFMVKRLLNITGELQADAADALAIAICHAHRRSLTAISTRA